MATHTVSAPTEASTKLNHQAFMLLRTIFTVAPILFGLDKFTNLLTDWTHYLAPLATDIIPVTPQVFMYGVGVIEIIAGILVALRPKIGSLVVCLWLLGIIVNLLIVGNYFDVGLRDFGLLVAALALNRLAMARDR
ncbi:hypothetical protein CQ018_03940 [Arthrobacter sp. MYb227]|uniref:DoxX family membrane protein n=1 Tax=Arthrobacter sp. MYb227 TaxID=1848601 RepID=UPI000CFCC2F5|nr:DoxX family membrane protein [Arthrobacter sp. MYb227]PQZ96413.1 hypothetical protein CQ018_03940 [Arthrobacter sp. MYb227]